MKKRNYLISGSSSGLGKYLREQLSGISFNRAGLNIKKTDIIIHCAFNKSKDVSSENFYEYLLDNVFLTKKLIKIPHKKFIYISSLDVYPKNNKKHSENKVIDVNQISGVYAITKLMSESLIQNLCPNFLILRCSALLGRDARENSLIKIIEGIKELTLSGGSTFNYVLHSDIFDFINYAIKKDIRGTYNIASSKNISLLEVANMLKKKIKFGSYIYNVGEIDNSKISSIFPAFKKTSKEVILQFIKE